MAEQAELTRNVKKIALAHGADLVGAVAVNDLPEHRDRIARILPRARSVLVTVSKHSLAALRSGANQTAQFDTIHAYGQCARAAQEASRFLESKGFGSVAVPAFIPIDMEEPGKGMRGEICWRRAGVRAGLGSYGENGLLVTGQFGSAIRISGLVTEADLDADSPLEKDLCDHCLRCVDSCPSGALSGEGKINKKLCGDFIFKFGFRFFQQFMEGFARKQKDEMRELLRGHELREMWQTFMTGNYYYCFACQFNCPAEELPDMAD